MTCISVGWIVCWFNAYSMENVAMRVACYILLVQKRNCRCPRSVMCHFAGESINVILLQPLWSLSPTVFTEFRVIELFVLMEYLLVSKNGCWWVFTKTMTLGKVSVFSLALFWVIVINLNPYTATAQQWFLYLAMYSCKWQQSQVKSLQIQIHISCLWRCAWLYSRSCNNVSCHLKARTCQNHW